MNCPSRTDDSLQRPGWNQNPPCFAADLTTRQDMNGIVNARTLKDAEHLRSGCYESQDEKTETCSTLPHGMTLGEAGKGAKSPHNGFCTRFENQFTARHEYQDVVITPSETFTVSLKRIAQWLLAIFCTLVFLFDLRLSNYPSIMQLWLRNSKGKSKPPGPIMRVARSTCASGGGNSDYNLPFHVGALFIILFVSFTGCAFPLLVLKFPRLRVPASFLFSARHFGTGVLIATAFVHLLPTAFISLGDPCLSNFWTTDYPAMPGAIALAAIFFVTVIEMVFSPSQHICSGGDHAISSVSRNSHAHSQMQNEQRGRIAGGRELGPLHGRATSISRTLSRMGEENEILDSIETGRPENQNKANEKQGESAVEDFERNEHNHVLTPEQEHKKAVMQCFLLEVGILFHSVFIGMSLSVSVGSEFVILLIAIIFHQTFEGLALGARIASIDWPKNALQPWFMALAYGCTTPLGQAIGIATHKLYSPDSETGLLVVGIMNAISSGLLVFASLVELMSEDFLSDESWRVLRGKRRVWACILVFMGAFLMSLVGAWA
ncbi:Zip-domain-containing protein [Lojkania enalia]|uniref:Zip-domain-containing protein n=1 Tax=Lojkania enalia TaxID=147567 RepID=A0A9P4K1J3_9PLEO|nr:Zip-domain-containing protein [Didymosphaeria enalia]